LQVPRVQVPVEQDSLALARSQVRLQAPQLDNVVSEASQPSEALPLQLPQPELQVPMAQLPLEHDSVALARSHRRPQAPQLVSEVRETSQPSPQLPLQLPQPELQVQVLLPQKALLLQRLPHDPQLALSDEGFTSQPSDQLVLQLRYGEEQAQLPELQAAKAPQLLPQRPQLAGSVEGLASQPSDQVPLQSR
jgi:hypothetical protein